MKIPVNYLRAMLLFCGKNDIRWYLNGVAIQGDKLIATDGHRMTVCKLSADTGLDVVIGRQALTVALQLQCTKPKGKFGHEIEITEDRVGDVFYECIKNHSVYPDWRKVVPEEFECAPIENIGFNASYMADYARMSKLLGINHCIISLRAIDASSPIIIHIDGTNDFFSILMPARISNSAKLPDWAVTK